MTNETQMIMEMLKQMSTQLDSMEKDIKEVKTDVKELRVEMNDFKQLSTEEHDRVVEKLDTITRLTANNAEKISYLAGEVGKHSMILNVMDKQ